MANSNPGFAAGQIPTAPQWNAPFTSKVDEVDGNIVSPTISGTVAGSPTYTGSITWTGAALIMNNLPTSNAGLAPGTIWSNEGVLCIA